MTKRKRDSLKKYTKMIKVAKTFNSECYPVEAIMKFQSGTGWHSDDCPYCQKYATKNIKGRILNLNCVECELSDKKFPYSRQCCKRLWFNLQFSTTWKEWIKYAKKILKYIEVHG